MLPKNEGPPKVLKATAVAVAMACHLPTTRPATPRKLPACMQNLSWMADLRLGKSRFTCKPVSSGMKSCVLTNMTVLAKASYQMYYRGGPLCEMNYGKL